MGRQQRVGLLPDPDRLDRPRAQRAARRQRQRHEGQQRRAAEDRRKRPSRHEVEYGKPYPRGELSRGGSALQELMARYKLLQEQQLNVPASWIPETHQTIDPSLATQAPASAEVTRL